MTAGIAFIGVITAAGNIFLAVNRDAIDKAAAGCFTHKISLGGIVYVFPGRIFLKNVSVQNPASPAEKTEFTVPKISARFSLRRLLFGRSLEITGVTLYSSRISYHPLSRFLEDNFQRILEMIRNLPRHDISIRIKETLLDLAREGRPDYAAMELALTLRDDAVTGTGLLRRDQYRFSSGNGGKAARVAKGRPLWYSLKGRLKSDGLSVDRLVLKRGDLYSKLWGSVRGGLLKVNGFLFADTSKRDSDDTQPAFLHDSGDFPADGELSNVDVYILDINGRLRLALPEIGIERFDFTLNHMPVSLEGNVSLRDPFSLDMRLSFRHGRSAAAGHPFFKKADVTLAGVWKDHALYTNGQMSIRFTDHAELSFSPERARVAFEDLSFYLDEYRRPGMNLSRGDIAYWTNENEHRLSVQDFKAAANMQKGGLKVIEMDAPFYGGSLDGRMWIDSSRTPAKVSSLVVLTDVNTETLEELLIHFAKFNGRLSGKMNFTNVPRLDLSGEINIYDGRLTDFAFFNWVGDSFRLPALKAIDFGRASARFSMNKERLRLYDIYLRTADVRIGGYFDVDSKNLVSSRLGLTFSRELLSQSSKFRPILKIFEGDASPLDFDFRLSGNLDAMNFQWLPSEVKQRIQDRIPDFIERMIERDVDKMMDENG